MNGVVSPTSSEKGFDGGLFLACEMQRRHEDTPSTGSTVRGIGKRPTRGYKIDQGGIDMDATNDILLGKWKELKGQVRQQWGKLTDDDVTRLSGKTEELSGVLQQRYGYDKAKADTEINNWLSKH